jgi:hypothetical protein
LQGQFSSFAHQNIQTSGKKFVNQLGEIAHDSFADENPQTKVRKIISSFGKCLFRSRTSSLHQSKSKMLKIAVRPRTIETPPKT